MAAHDPSHRFHWHYNELDDKNFQLRGRGNILVAGVVIALLLLVLLLCAYVRRKCRQRRRGAAVATEQRSGSGSGRGAGGLRRAEIDALPVVVVKAGEEEGQCSICLSGVAAGQKVRVLPGCNHRFHSPCVDEWLGTHSSCPLCRASPLSRAAASV